MSDTYEKIAGIFLRVLFVGFVVIIGAIVMVKFYKEVASPKPSVECRSGKLFEVSHEGNITIYDPTFDDCEVKQ